MGPLVSRFPARTLILMTLALLAFVSFWWRTHQEPTRAPLLVPVQMVLIDGGAP